MKPNKENGFVILDKKLYDNVLQEIIVDASKFEKLNENPTFKCKASLQSLLQNLKQKTFLMKMYMIKFLLVSMVLLKYTNFSLMIHILNFVQLFYLYVLLIIILPVSFEIFLPP